MGRVIVTFTMSLDGFIAGPDDDVGYLLRWYRSGDTPFPVAGTDMVFSISGASAELLREEWGQVGAIVTGRRDFDVSRAWGGRPPLGVPAFIVTHQAPPEWTGPGSPFTFVSEGVPRAIEQARRAAGDRDVMLNGTSVVRQALAAGLVDALAIDVATVLLGRGIRLFDQLGPTPIDLEQTRVVAGGGVTHLRYRVIR